MRPELFRIADLGVPSYFGLLVAGFMFATAIGVIWARRVGEDPDVIVDLGLSTLLMGVVGGRILHVLADGYFWDYVHLCTDPTLVDFHLSETECLKESTGAWDATRGVCHGVARDCFAWAKFWAGGLAYYGGFLGALVSSWYLLKADRFSYWRASDMAGMVVPVGLAFGRMGCLLAGCCFGVNTESALALIFPGRSPASESQFKAGLLAAKALPSLPVHPTQIYESAASLAIAAFCLIYVHPRKRYDGQVFLSFVTLYAAARFILEFWRRDDRGELFGLSTSQLIGLLLIAGSIAAHRYLRDARINKGQPGPVPA
jgi:phosphatidylglycerol---prolipoprotein diacylglyceryl transferase